jgi:hypothetical protein
MTYFQLFEALQRLGPDALQKQVQILDDNAQTFAISSFLTGEATEGFTDDPFQSLLLL